MPAEAAPLTPVDFAGLMEAEDAMESADAQGGEGGKGSKHTIPNQYIKAGSQSAPDLGKKIVFSIMEGAGDEGMHRAGGQRKETNQLHNGKSAPWLLRSWLRPSGLVFLRVRHAKSGPINHGDA